MVHDMAWFLSSQGVLLWCGGKSARITRCTVEGHEFAGGVVCQVNIQNQHPHTCTCDSKRETQSLGRILHRAGGRRLLELSIPTSRMVSLR